MEHVGRNLLRGLRAASDAALSISAGSAADSWPFRYNGSADEAPTSDSALARCETTEKWVQSCGLGAQS